MTIDIRQLEREHELELSGAWEALDAVNLKKALSSVPPDTKKLSLLVTKLDPLPLDGVQVVLAYIRYARSIPKPVHVYFDKRQLGHYRLWGLDRSGWENFFHGR